MYTLKTAVWEHHPEKVKNHIPYFICMTVEGPRGGLYLLDEFCSERLVFEYARHNVGQLDRPFSWMTFAKANNMEIMKVDLYDKINKTDMCYNNLNTAMTQLFKKGKSSVKLLKRIPEDIALVEKMAYNIKMTV